MMKIEEIEGSAEGQEFVTDRLDGFGTGYVILFVSLVLLVLGGESLHGTSV